MKFKSFLLLVALPMLTLIGCDKPVDLGPAKVEANTEVINAPAEGGEFTVELVATINWNLKGYTDQVKEWVNISPESGKASAQTQTITITLLENSGASRNASIEFFGDILTKASLTINQAGSVAQGNGTLEAPFTPSAALEFINTLAADKATSEEYYISGTISNIKEIDPSFGNATFSISDDGTENNELLVYRSYYLDGAKFTSADQMKVGDKVTVLGKLINFKGNTPEVNQGGKVYSHNGNSSTGGGTGGGSSTQPSEYPASQPSLTKISIADFLAKSTDYEHWYELTGEIVGVEKEDYGNITIKDETGSVYVYGVTSKWIGAKNDKSYSSLGLKKGDIITIGTLRQDYSGTPQAGGNWCAAFYISHIEGKPAEELSGVTLKFPDDNSANNQVNGYDDPWTAKSGSYEFSMKAFNNYKWDGWTYVRCGRKAASVASIATVTAMPKISAVVVSVDKILTVADVNSITLDIYSDANLKTKVGETISVTPSVGDLRLDIPAASQKDAQYYVITIDCKASTDKKNGIVQISKVVYVAI